MPDDWLTGRVAVVTGASRGLGLVIAEHLCSLGAHVALCSRGANECADIARALAHRFETPTWGAAVDVSSASGVARFAAEVLDRLGPAEILVNNAAIVGPIGTLRLEDAAVWSDAIDVNVKGVALTVAAFADQLAAENRGRVINLSGGGVGGPNPMMRASAYLASKYAVVGLTEALADELGMTGVTVNAIAPGALPTTFLNAVVEAGPDTAGAELFSDAASRSGSIEAHHVRPFLNLLDYLLSDDGSHISGRVLSARWETPDVLDSLPTPVRDSLYRLRRIDDDLHTEVPT